MVDEEDDEVRDQLEHVSEQLRQANLALRDIAKVVGLDAWPDAEDFHKRLVKAVEKKVSRV